MSLPFAIPVLETERLTLREPRESDMAAMIAFGASSRTQYMGGTFDHYGAWRLIAAAIGHWALRGYGYWSVDRKSDQVFVGRVGVILPGWATVPELAYHLLDGFEGQGYATEAVLAARAFSYREFGMGPLVSCIDSENVASIAVARRVGAAFESAEPDDGRITHIYRHPGPGVLA